MPIKLYAIVQSPPARAVMMASEIYNVPVEMVHVDLIKRENFTPDYLKLNPLHTVPVLVDGDVVLHDSHAILIYLSEVYGKNNSFYPSDAKGRALVNQKLFFNNSYLFPRMQKVLRPLFMGDKQVQQQHLDEIKEVYDFLEEFLSRSKYLAGDNITIADVAALPTVSALNYIVPIDSERYPKIKVWFNEMENQSYSKQHNEAGAKMLGKFVENNMK